jgi:hypothetical protein
MATNPTDDEIDTEIDRIEQRLHDEFLVSPEIYVRLEALIKSKAHTDAIAEQDERYKIHERYHELNDKDIETKAYSRGYKEGQKDASKEILDLLKQMKKEPPAEEYPEDIYTIGYLTALSRAELEIEKLIKKVD